MQPQTEHYDAVLRKRAAPCLVVLSTEYQILNEDARLEEILRGAGLARAAHDRLPTLIEEAVRQLTKAVAEGTQAGAASVPVPGLLLYTSVLSGPSGSCVAVSLQRLRMRDAVTSAAARYDLTVRECNVLDLILHGYETREIAQRLNIAESTVGEYVKHLHIKMRAKHRSEMLARVFEWPELSFET